MECTHNAALHDRPESFDGVGMDCAVNIFVLTMTNNAMREVKSELAIGFPFIGRDQANLCGYGFTYKGIKSFSTSVVDHSGNDVAFAPDCAHNDSRTRSASPAEVSASTFPLVLILGFAADKSFVNFHIADELLELDITQGSANLVAHKQSGIVRTKAHVAH